MAITQTEKRGSGPNRLYTARHFDDAATPALVTLYPGFKPRKLKVINLTDRISYEWFEGMAQGDYLKTVAAGTRTLETDDVVIAEVDEGERPSITLAASIVLQNKQFSIVAEA